MMMYFVLGDLGWRRMCVAQNGRKLAVQEEVESDNDKRAPPLSLPVVLNCAACPPWA